VNAAAEEALLPATAPATILFADLSLFSNGARADGTWCAHYILHTNCTRSGARVLVASSRTASKRLHHNKAQSCTSYSNPEQLDGRLNDHMRTVYFNSNTDT
jgi:hypothetical protein